MRRHSSGGRANEMRRRDVLPASLDGDAARRVTGIQPAVQHRLAVGTSHLVRPEILVVETFEPAPQLLVVDLVGDRGGQFGTLQYAFIDVNRTIEPQSKGERVTRPRI